MSRIGIEHSPKYSVAAGLVYQGSQSHILKKIFFLELMCANHPFQQTVRPKYDSLRV